MQQKALNSYAYYTGVGFQMIAIIGLFTYIGYRIDQSGNSHSILFTAICSLAGVLISLYTVIKSVMKKAKDGNGKEQGGRRSA